MKVGYPLHTQDFQQKIMWTPKKHHENGNFGVTPDVRSNPSCTEPPLLLLSQLCRMYHVLPADLPEFLWGNICSIRNIYPYSSRTRHTNPPKTVAKNNPPYRKKQNQVEGMTIPKTEMASASCWVGTKGSWKHGSQMPVASWSSLKTMDMYIYICIYIYKYVYI